MRFLNKIGAALEELSSVTLLTQRLPGEFAKHFVEQWFSCEEEMAARATQAGFVVESTGSPLSPCHVRIEGKTEAETRDACLEWLAEKDGRQAGIKLAAVDVFQSIVKRNNSGCVSNRILGNLKEKMHAYLRDAQIAQRQSKSNDLDNGNHTSLAESIETYVHQGKADKGCKNSARYQNAFKTARCRAQAEWFPTFACFICNLVTRGEKLEIGLPDEIWKYRDLKQGDNWCAQRIQSSKPQLPPALIAGASCISNSDVGQGCHSESGRLAF